jgi:DNA-binding transcriptional regulator of glucitol operon
VLRLLVTPRWLVRHVLLIALLFAFAKLGLWQWHRSHESSGTLQNSFYAFQWWGFGLFAIFGWWKMLQLEHHPPAAPTAELAVPAQPAGDGTTEVIRAAAAAQIARDETEHDEVAAYNRYLSWLNAHPQR